MEKELKGTAGETGKQGVPLFQDEEIKLEFNDGAENVSRMFPSGINLQFNSSY